MTKRRIIWLGIAITLTMLLMLAIILLLWVSNINYGFARTVSDGEQALRLQLVQQAESCLGAKEGDSSHKAIIDIYNSHTPLAQGYAVSYSDSWCAAFVSAAAIECGFTDIIPTECGCQRQIALFEALGCWVEDDQYTPLPGDIIYYSWNDRGTGDCTDWSDHVGIVVGTANGYIKVIEGNFGSAVQYRYLPIGASGIRGFAVPDYAEAAKNA